MRKWMRERMQRRKKSTEDAPAEGKPAPLQPAYFDAAGPAAEAPVREPVSDVEHESGHEPVGESESAEPSAPSDAPATSGGATRRPQRRRTRGGRGRGRAARPAPAHADAGEVDGNRVEAAGGAVASGKLAPEVTPVATAPASPRASKGTVVLAIGLPGSGKSSWFKRHSISPLSSDMLRALLFDDPAEQRFQDLVFSNLRSMLKARLIARRPANYVDTTNLTPQERQSWIKLAQDYGYEVQAVYFDVPLEVCLERNSRRPRTVPDDVMRRMAGKLKAPAFDEGFSKITVVRVKQKE